jgi:leucine dehydrogenase
MTGLGVYMGMKSCAKEAWGKESLTGKTVALQGFGKVATYTAHHLMKEDAKLVVTDVFDDALDRARDMGLTVVKPDDIYCVDCDIFAPCALGGVLNTETIPQLKCKVVAGGANNQLLSATDGEELHRLGIVYGPDYILNSGGIINAEAEIGRAYNSDRAREKTERIYETMDRVIAISKVEEITTGEAADRLAEDRLKSVRGIRKIYRSN